MLKKSVALALLLGLVSSCSGGSGSEVSASDLVATGGFWGSLAIDANEVEGFSSIVEMRNGADAVVLGRFVGFEYSRALPDESVLFPAIMAVGLFEVDEVVRGELSPGEFAAVEFTVGLGPAEKLRKEVELMTATFPEGDALLFLRLKPGESSPKYDELYRTVNSFGLVTATDRSPIDSPLRGYEDRLDQRYRGEVSEVGSLGELVQLLK